MMPCYTQISDPAVRYRAELSRQEAESLAERELKCPECGYLIAYAFSDAAGHFRIKCKKCKTVSVLNFAYFCRRRRRWNSWRYYTPHKRR